MVHTAAFAAVCIFYFISREGATDIPRITVLF